MPRIEAERLRRVVERVLESAGSDEREAAVVADHLVRANLTGHDSHGVGLIPTYVRNLAAGLLVPNRHVETVRDDGAILMFDGHRGYGQVQAREATALAAERCADTGVVLWTLRNAHHVGRIGTYGEQAIESGLVSLHFVNVTDHPPVVAPHGGTRSRFVTNPVCVAVPGTERTPPVVLDMATSKIALGKARVALGRGEPVPDDTVLDADGRATTDPAVLFSEPLGALLPFGDHKGSGLALLCELLAGGLSGGGTIQPGNPRRGSTVNNMFSILIDPARLVDLAWLGQEIDALVAYVHDTPSRDGVGPVRVAGEPEREAAAERGANGLPLAEAAWEGILDAAAEVGVLRPEVEAMLA